MSVFRTTIALLGALVAWAAMPAPALADPASGVVAGYDPDRGAFVRTTDGRWELNPYAMVQVTHVTTGRSSEIDSTGFNLRAAKLILHGHVFDPSLTTHFQLNVGDGKAVAEDIYLHWRPAPEIAFLVGQYEVTFNRQHITLEAYQELVERSLVDARFNLQRDVGVVTYLSDAERRYEATFGFWNGARQNAVNDDTGYLGTLRLSYNPFGPIVFREADLDHERSPKLSLAAAAAYNPERVVPAATGTAKTSTLHHVTQAVGETTFRWRGLSLTTETHVRRQAGDDGKPRWDAGGFVQAGIFVVPRHLQLAARAARVVGATVASDPVGEQTFGVSYYFRGHRLKVQADGSRLETLSSKDGWRARVQLEFFL